MGMGMIKEYDCTHCKGTGLEKIYVEPIKELEKINTVKQEEVLKAIMEEVIAEMKSEVESLDAVEKKVAKPKAKPRAKSKK